MPEIPFSVDSALLKELGERLVGKPHIALAELVKNSYDADATRVVIRFGSDDIEVADNGHGMDFDEFKRFWMRIGTPHKQADRVSHKLKRPVTGSKGVGRLAVQFLGKKLEIRTVSERDTDSELVAQVNWEEAVEAGELTQAVARYEEVQRETAFAGESSFGTRIVLTTLNQEWSDEEFRELAREIWWLQPPFRSNPDLATEEQKSFEVKLESPSEQEVRKFDSQMHAFLDIWDARLAGKLTESVKAGTSNTATVRFSLEFSDGTRINKEHNFRDCALHEVEFEIRIFDLVHRQPRGIKVAEAREYLKEFGGVHVYDSGFHLPYYGPEIDWLNIEMDHSHRLSKSKLLPEDLQVQEGMNYLPTQSRIYGVVHVNTPRERELTLKGGRQTGESHLQIQVTRDRLVDNESFRRLTEIVRWALDFYAMQEAKRAYQEAEAKRAIEPAREKFERVDQVLLRYRRDIPEPAYSTIQSQVHEAVRASEAENELLTRRAGLLGALATAGISAIAFQHEENRQLQLLRDIAQELEGWRPGLAQEREYLRNIARRLRAWVEQASRTRALFSGVMDEEGREKKGRLKAVALIEQVKVQMDALARDVTIETTGVQDALRLPRGTFAEWSAIFQNVFTNAVNAMLDVRKRLIVVGSRVRRSEHAIIVQDTGVGVDLSSAEELFEPFVRRLKLSPERRALGLGGTGLGLTIVRMIAGSLNCRVGFVRPTRGFSTAFQLSWSERK
jgi:signal transduction histidine kinase